MDMKKTIMVSLLTTFLSATALAGNVVKVEGGLVEGVPAEIAGVTVYRGIPYAAPPLGNLRWKAPQPVIPWQGVKKADKFGHPGYQSVHYPGGYTTEWGYGDEAPYSEDCLYLNVWTKAPGDPSRKLPVALWIHGGGYQEGWGSEPEFDGQEIANKDVALVSINYRLGIFGFMPHPELSAESPHHVSGNYGIQDQIQALRWIRVNIAQFGGDPDNVMIFGQSAGAGSVRTLCASPLTRGLFNKAIIMSGGGLSTAKESSTPAVFRPITMQQAEQNTKKIMDWAGLTSLEKMRKASTEMLYSLGRIYQAATGDKIGITQFPIVDGYVSTETFDDAAVNGDLPNIPIMIGFTLNDIMRMGEGIGLFCTTMEKQGRIAWAYQFARPLPTDGRSNVLEGAFHSSDLWYVFKSLKHNTWRPWTAGDWQLSERMLTAWTNFCKYGNPNGNADPKDKKAEWKPYTKKNPQMMVFHLDAADKDASAMGFVQ